MKPVLQALVLADRVYTDQGTGKKVIAGTFNSIRFKNGPPVVDIVREDGSKQQAVLGGMRSGSPWAYISLTDVCNGTHLLLQFVNLSKNVVLFQTELRVDCDDRLKTVEIVLPLPRLPIKEEGTYAFEVVWEKEILGSHRIIAREFSDLSE